MDAVTRDRRPTRKEFWVVHVIANADWNSGIRTTKALETWRRSDQKATTKELKEGGRGSYRLCR